MRRWPYGELEPMINNSITLRTQTKIRIRNSDIKSFKDLCEVFGSPNVAVFNSREYGCVRFLFRNRRVPHLF